MSEARAGDLPEVFREFFGPLSELRDTRQPENAFHRCFGCGPARPDGLWVRCFRSGDGVVSPIVVAPRYEGPPGAVHGGIVAAHLDEVLGGAVLAARGAPAVTGELTVRYVKPVPLATPVLGRGRVVADHGRYVDVEGSLELFPAGTLLARARVRFFPITG